MDIRIALAGNPNSGKTTLFNELTGSNQFVGNWPGVTVEKKEGRLIGSRDVIITDLPGVYSLSPYTLEEVVARNYLIGERPDAILNIIDGTNLERNLYLTSQLLEIGIPVVGCINMIDVVRKTGDNINVALLSETLGIPICEISALRGEGCIEAAQIAAEAARAHTLPPIKRFSGSVEHALAHIEEAVLHDMPEQMQRWYSVKIFERDEKVLAELSLDPAILAHIEKDIVACEKEADDDSDAIIISQRYDRVEAVIRKCYEKKPGVSSITEKIDRIVTNRILALPIFAGIMFLVYFISVSTVGTWATDFMTNTLFGEIITPAVEDFLVSVHCADWLTGLIVHGIIGGVGSVLGFVPQMLVLFLFLAFLEACGYMSRIAFIMDKVFRKFGLSGKSFIPILIGTGCGVPGIMSSRTIENESDRRMTIITTTFIPCGAKLPMIALITGALFNGAWWVAPLAYFIGIASIILSGIILKKTKAFVSEDSPFVMELPPYHMPTFKNLMRSMWERGWSFIKKAGTVILLGSIIVWFTTSYGFTDGSFGAVENIDHALLAKLGSFIAVIFTPLGFGTWQAAVSTLLGLVAKEEVVGALGTIFSVADALDVVESGNFSSLNAITEHFTALSGFSFLMFNLLCAPCFAAMGAIRREMMSGKWTAFAITYQCLFAYAVSLCIYRFGLLITEGSFTFATAAAIAVLGFFLFLLFRKPYAERRRKTNA